MHPALPARVRAWRALLSMTLAAVALLAAASPASAQDTGPLFYGGTVTPTEVDENGGQISITAKGLDDFGIFMFYADVSGSNGYVESVALYPSNIPDDPNQPWTFSGTGTIPPNTSGDPVTYGVSATVTDTSGQFASGTIGEVRQAAQPNFDDEPAITAASAAPSTVPARGGKVTATATVTDDSKLESVVAAFSLPGRGTTAVDLSAAAGSSDYQGVFDVPSNTSATPLIYQVYIVATDDAGQAAARAAGTVTVEPAPAQPAGQLALSPTFSLLGPVRPGASARATFTVRNTGKLGGPTLTAFAAVSGTGFSILGAQGREQTLAVAPGQSTKVVVQFAPARRGAVNGRLTIRRQDGLQRSPTATLLGLSY
ncbi:MAG: hypothetical protein JHD16_09270 [Solirubrobacteraceae bacterium]|nr:hypothetical protein [Solirubrobacteraceae bacterium]